MKKNQLNPLYKNIIFLLALIIICSFLVRILLSGETLSDYAKSHGISETNTSEDISGNLSGAVSGNAPSGSVSSLEGSDLSGNSPDTASESISSVSTGTASATQAASDAALSPDTSGNDTGHARSDAMTDQKDFYSVPIDAHIKSRITGVSFPADADGKQIKLEDLRYLHLLYYNFNQQASVGEMICNKSIAPDLLSIFRSLYENHYEIDKIQLIDDFQGDDELSMENDNTSSFNYRTIAGSEKLSKHSAGLAVDINPFYNPEILYSANGEISSISPSGSDRYAARSADTAHEISHNDLAYKLFTKYGFTWGGDWKTKKDYQHFEK